MATKWVPGAAMPFRTRALGALALLMSVAATSACTPDTEALLAWLHDQSQTAEASGQPCPELAGDLAWRGLPSEFLDVIWRESRCDPAAVNPSSGALGLTQIMPFWLTDLCEAGIACTPEDLLQSGTNLDAAEYVYGLQGWAAWSPTR
jgi:soluble lytic murein transglycosylase-like protein